MGHSAVIEVLSPVNAHMGNNHSNPSQCELIDRCGHRCGGVEGETNHSFLERFTNSNQLCNPESCIGCLECHLPDAACPICLELLTEAPSIRLTCGHTAHCQCVKEMLRAVDWRGKEIIPSQLHCPAGCGRHISHRLLNDLTSPLVRFATDAAGKAAAAAAADGQERPAEAYRVFLC